MKNILFIFSLICVSLSVSAQTSWSSLGPVYDKPRYMGSGLVNAVEFHPTDPDSIYIGTYGGIWQTANGGNSWAEFAVGKEFNHTVTVSDIAVDKLNANILYASTGSKETSRMSNFYIIEHPTSGIYRCVVNGNTKTWTNISNGLPDMNVAYGIERLKVGYFIHVIEQDPFDPNILYAGTSVGLFKTTNLQSASPIWQKVTSIPSVPILTLTFTGINLANRVIYISGKNLIYKSVDNINWIEIAGACVGCLDYNTQPEIQSEVSALIATVQQGLNVTSTTHYVQYYVEKSLKYPGQIYASAIVYVLTKHIDANNNPQEFGKNYKYILRYDGVNWDTSPGHILKLRESGGNQQPPSSTNISGYNPHIAVAYDPLVSTNESIYAAYEGIEGYVENSASSTGYFYFKTGYPYASVNGSEHPDFHALKYNPLDHYLYGGNDGFLAKYTPVATYADSNMRNRYVALSNANLNCARIWHLSVSPLDPSRIALGIQDNGSMVLSNNTWNTTFTGDGLSQLYHGSAYSYCNQSGCFLNGYSYKFNNDGAWKVLEPNVWYYKYFYADPMDINTIYVAGGWSLFKSVNQSTNLSLVTNFSTISNGSWNNISAMAISPRNNNRAYVAMSSPINQTWGLQLYRTNDLTSASPSWTKLFGASINGTDAKCRGLVVSSVDENTVFMCLTNNSASTLANRVKISTNGGDTWSDYNQSSSIPSIYQIHCLLYEKGSNDGVYAGTDNGVYYTNKGMSTWIRYDAGLPNVAVTGMEYSPMSNKITVSTWGRGVWDIYPYCVPVGNVSITDQNYLNYVNRPTNANGVITFKYSGLPITSTPMRYELKATDGIEFLPGARFYGSSNTHTILDAYIMPCHGGSPYPSNGGSRQAMAGDDPVLEVKEDEVEVLKIFPNPNGGELNLLFKMQHGDNATVHIYNLEGSEVYTSALAGLANEVYKINLYDQPDGMYIVKVIKNGKDSYTSKLLLRKLGNTNGPSPIDIKVDKTKEAGKSKKK